MDTFKRSAALALAAVVAMAGCSGKDGSNGANGSNGTNGTNGVAGKLSLKIDGVSTATVNGVVTSTLTFTISPAADVCPGGACDATLATMGKKTFYATEYASASNTFTTAKNFSFSNVQFKGITADGNGAQYTATKSGASFAPESSSSAFIYAYVTTANTVVPPSGNYYLADSVASAAKVYGSVPYTSTANVSACERCHGAPYAKHGYRMATVAGLNDFVACKACHTDQRAGHDAAWQLLAEDPAAYAAQAGTPTAAQETKYAYTASIMNDTHMSHAMEFAYPQSMSNCVTCHEGKLASILTEKNFTLKTCKSCHPVTNAVAANADPKRAPALADIMPLSSGSHNGIAVPAALYEPSTATCNGCHADTSATLKFAAIHTGYNKLIYAADGSRYSSAITTTIGTVTFATNSLTIPFTINGAAAGAKFAPTVVVSLYGYGTKDFLISGHSSTGGVRNLEATFPTNTTRMTITQGTNSNEFTAVADLSLWAANIGVEVKTAEIAILPALGLNQAATPDNNPFLADGVTPNTAYNPYIAISGATSSFDLVGTAGKADAYGKAIVDPAKCNACHDALGTTFHSPAYGSAGVVACRLCHTVASGGSHLEMQSRSIDSYVHAIHSMQPFDIGDINFADPVAKLRYEHHIESNYPNFAGALNCESCHVSGTYDVPNQTRSLPGLLSAADAVTTTTRAIGTVAAEITGPGARACGSCHRSKFINEDDVAGLAALYAHTNMYSSDVTDTTLFLTTAAYVESLLGGPAFTGTVPAGAAIEQCTICHATSGGTHQSLFNTWRNGL